MSKTVTIQNGFYGVLVPKKDGGSFFEPYGREVTVTKIIKSTEKILYEFELTFTYGYDIHSIIIPRGKLSDPHTCPELANLGIDVERKHYDVFFKSLLIQEDALLQNFKVTFSYDNLGWQFTPVISDNGRPKLCFRSCKLITENAILDGKYRGNFQIKPQGALDAWLNMVKEDVLPYTPLSLVLLCSMSAITLGLLSYKYPIGNGIMHLCAVSSAGKTTGAYLATSVAGEAFMAARTEWENDVPVEKLSLLQSFSSTENALIGKQSGNIGIPIIIDELGKYTGGNLTQTIFNLFDGGSKTRYNKDLKIMEQAGFRGTIITTGEFSLFDKCDKNLEGLYNRVFKVSDRLTNSAEHSDRIKRCCIENNGRIAPRLAKHILDNGGLDYVVPKYEYWKNFLREKLPSVPFKEKFIDTFPALYLTTADIAKESLGLEFNTKTIVEYFFSYLESSDNAMNISLQSYDYLIKEFMSNSSNFYQKKGKNDIETHGTVWGRYESVDYEENDCGKKIAGKYLVRQNIVHKLLKDAKYTKAQCVGEWKANDLIDYEKGRNTRSRKIDLSKEAENVYVFYVFATEEDADA